MFFPQILAIDIVQRSSASTITIILAMLSAINIPRAIKIIIIIIIIIHLPSVTWFRRAKTEIKNS